MVLQSVEHRTREREREREREKNLVGRIHNYKGRRVWSLKIEVINVRLV